uniref:C2H2 AKAP95-type domain-containing protein n=1 Tax=Hucho hucho TaxID=62062 RepID=A0A4W5LLJ2_9TELE
MNLGQCKPTYSLSFLLRPPFIQAGCRFTTSIKTALSLLPSLARFPVTTSLFPSNTKTSFSLSLPFSRLPSSLRLISPPVFRSSPTITSPPLSPVVSMQEEISQMKKKLQTGKQTPPQDKVPKNRRKRGGFLERSGVTLTPKSQTQRVTFACSVCKFRSFYHEDMAAHLESKFHKDHFKFLSSQLSKPTTDFLQEYLNNKYKKTEQRTSQMENHCAAICQVYKEQDLTRRKDSSVFMLCVPGFPLVANSRLLPPPHTTQTSVYRAYYS